MAKPATQATFESILDTPVAAVERPKPLPTGTYDGIVKGLYEEGESAQKKTPFVRFTYALQAAHEDVDADELDAVGGLADKTIKDTYYTTPDALFRLTTALENFGIEDLESKTVRQALAETPNCGVRFVISHRPSQDGQSVFAEVKTTLKIED